MFSILANLGLVLKACFSKSTNVDSILGVGVSPGQNQREYMYITSQKIDK
jgi:hypothetical protein